MKSQMATASFMWAFFIPSTSTAFFVAFNKINGEGDVRLLSAEICWKRPICLNRATAKWNQVKLTVS